MQVINILLLVFDKIKYDIIAKTNRFGIFAKIKDMLNGILKQLHINNTIPPGIYGKLKKYIREIQRSKI